MQKKNVFLQANALLVLIFLLTACSGNSGSATNHNSSTASAPTTSAGPQACPDAVNNSAYWDSLIPTQANVSMVESVTCGYLKGESTLQALVTVSHFGSGAILDVYVYDNLTAAQPTRIFQLQNLIKGDAKISLYNSVITSEVDTASIVNVNQPNAAVVQDLFREFKWSAGAGTLVQIAFPGIFPDLTRYQAESDQQQVNQGEQTWKLSATLTAQALGARLLHWNPNARATLVSGGGQHDTQAVVNLQNTTAASSTLQISLARLEGNTNGGIWIVTTVRASSLSITAPQSADLIHSPLTITGNSSAGIIGTVKVLDHLYTDLGHAPIQSTTANGPTTFSTNLTYQPTFTTGAEEGLIMLSEAGNAGEPVATATVVKVLIQ